jgi:hypothetical protein
MFGQNVSEHRISECSLSCPACGGFLVTAGFFAWLGALLLARFTVAATLLGNRF